MSDEREREDAAWVRERILESIRLAEENAAQARRIAEDSQRRLRSLAIFVGANLPGPEPDPEDPPPREDPPDPPRPPAEPRPEPPPQRPGDVDTEVSTDEDGGLSTVSIRQHASGVQERVSHMIAGRRSEEVSVDPPRGWEPGGPRELYRGETIALPRTLAVGRLLRGGTPEERESVRRFAHAPTPAAQGYLDGYGPCESRVAVFPEESDHVDLTRGTRHGPWWPISESMGADGEFSRDPGGPGGRWIGPVQGVESAAYWWLLHCRVMDRMTVAAWSLDDAVNPRTGLVDSEQYSLQARFNPKLSILPDGTRCETAPEHAGDPMAAWQSTCGNGGYDAEHYIRAFRAALALASYYPDLRWMVEPAVLAMARDCRLYLSEFPARKDAYGPGENPTWMLRSSLAYRSTGPQYVVRSLAHPWHCIAAAMWLGHADEFAGHAHAALDYMRQMVLPSGFSQAMPHDYGNPAPAKYGGQPGQFFAADIESYMPLHSAWALVLQLRIDYPEWLIDATQRVAQHYLTMWGNWPKYWRTRVDGLDVADAKPYGKGDGWNVGTILELAARFTPLRDKILARKGDIEGVFIENPTHRPHWSGLVGTLND